MSLDLQHAAAVRPRQRPFSRRAFTLLELLTTLAIIAVVAALLLPALQNSFRKSRRIACTSQLKQVGLAFASWAHEHNDRYPMQVPASLGGTMELAELTVLNPNESSTYRHFQSLSNELVTPKVLLCPAEKQRTAAPCFATLRNENVSYWVNQAAVFGRVDSPLAGDRNVRTTGRTEWTFIQFGTGDGVEFSADLHGYRGNVLFGDSHVDTLDSQALRLAFAQITNTPNFTLALPARELPSEPSPALIAQPVPGPESGTGANSSAVANPQQVEKSGVASTSVSHQPPLAFGRNSGPPLAGAGATYGAVDLVVFTRLDGSFATSSVPRRFTNLATVTAPARPAAELEKTHPLVDLVQSAVSKAQRQINWLLMILAVLVALSFMDRMRRGMRTKKRRVRA